MIIEKKGLTADSVIKNITFLCSSIISLCCTNDDDTLANIDLITEVNEILSDFFYSLGDLSHDLFNVFDNWFEKHFNACRSREISEGHNFSSDIMIGIGDPTDSSPIAIYIGYQNCEDSNSDKTMANDMLNFEEHINNMGIETRTEDGDHFRDFWDIIADIGQFLSLNTSFIDDIKGKTFKTVDELIDFLNYGYSFSGITPTSTVKKILEGD